MLNSDEVIRHAAAAAAAHSREVRIALDAYLAAAMHDDGGPAARGLRVALVAQAAGHEQSAHDGATFAVRRAAAAAALAAWDGVTPKR